MRSTISKENEKNQQDRIAENAKLMTNIEEVRTALQEKLDAIIEDLTDHGDLQRGQDRHFEALASQMKELQSTLSEVHASIEGCTASITGMVDTMEFMRNEARDPQMVQGTGKWLGDFARQLVASGITSAITAVVVMVATRSESGYSEERRSLTPNPGAVPQSNDGSSSSTQLESGDAEDWRPSTSNFGVVPQPDDGFASSAQSNPSPKHSKFACQPLNPPTPPMLPESSETKITLSNTTSEDRNAFDRSLSRHDSSPTRSQTAVKTLPHILSRQDVYRYSGIPKQDWSTSSPSTQASFEKPSINRDKPNRPTKTMSNSYPTKSYTSNSASPGQSSQSSSKKTEASSRSSGSSKYTGSYSDTTSYSRWNSPSSFQSYHSYSRETENHDDSMLTSNATLSYRAAHRYPSQPQSKAVDRSSMEILPETWVWICCKCRWAMNMKELMIFERCAKCHHARDSRCEVVKGSVTGVSSSCEARTFGS